MDSYPDEYAHTAACVFGVNYVVGDEQKFSVVLAADRDVTVLSPSLVAAMQNDPTAYHFSQSTSKKSIDKVSTYKIGDYLYYYIILGEGDFEGPLKEALKSAHKKRKFTFFGPSKLDPFGSIRNSLNERTTTTHCIVVQMRIAKNQAPEITVWSSAKEDGIIDLMEERVYTLGQGADKLRRILLCGFPTQDGLMARTLKELNLILNMAFGTVSRSHSVVSRQFQGYLINDRPELITNVVPWYVALYYFLLQWIRAIKTHGQRVIESIISHPRRGIMLALSKEHPTRIGSSFRQLIPRNILYN